MDSPVKVMVVEDDKDFLYTIGYWLKSKGYTVVTASNGLEAVETVKKEPVDIVFLDLQMPVMDGVEALKNIRKLNKNLPVILITAYATDERISEAEQYGISGFFSKDKDFSESVTLIETILRVHRGLKKE
ncbi:MAG: hypothetical protein A2166_06680 [Omnitrophica WOR_2 bacterium RBG_13_41_10]|nr:MAG: hypothetical protein A2166_06680 [Omnitrophica WOR_2 bacterium RBG_13_41_10]